LEKHWGRKKEKKPANLLEGERPRKKKNKVHRCSSRCERKGGKNLQKGGKEGETDRGGCQKKRDPNKLHYLEGEGAQSPSTSAYWHRKQEGQLVGPPRKAPLLQKNSLETLCIAKDPGT